MDTPVRYSSMVQFGPVKPRPVRKCKEAHRYSPWTGCPECGDFKAKLDQWKGTADARYWCRDPSCHVCDAYESPDYGRSVVHGVWEQVDHSTLECNCCGNRFDGASGNRCECAYCTGCGEVYSFEDRCDNCYAHENCCGCLNCEDCERRVSGVCEHCNNCNSCCECVRCQRCANVSTRMCEHGYCHNCWSRCCDCQGGYTDEGSYTPILWRIEPTLANTKEFKRNPVKRLLGVEIETYARKWPKTLAMAKKWTAGIVHDSSIEAVRGVGFEVTTAPAMGSAFVQQIEELTKAAVEDGANVNRSCGLHCHVDASSYKWWDVQKLIKLYRVAEPELFAVCAPYRKNSSYSRLCGQSFYEQFVLGNKGPKELKAKLLSGFYAFDMTHAKALKAKAAAVVSSAYRQKYNDVRYNALNIHSWFRRGTIEFRHYHGTLNSENIINWAILCGRMVESAEELSDAEIDKLNVLTVIDALKLPGEVRKWMRERSSYMRTMSRYPYDEQESLECPECGNEVDECDCVN